MMCRWKRVNTEAGLPLLSWTVEDLAEGHPSAAATPLLSNLAQLLHGNLQVRQNLCLQFGPRFRAARYCSEHSELRWVGFTSSTVFDLATLLLKA